MPAYRIDSPAWQPARLNELMRSWQAAARLKKRDREQLGLLLAVLRAEGRPVPVAEGKRRVRLTVVLAPKCRGGDVDAFWKSLLDCLACHGLITGDAKECVELAPVAYVRGDRPGCVIELQDVEDADA